MSNRIVLLAALALVCAGQSSVTFAAEPTQKSQPTLTNLSLEVAALQTIHRFQMTPQQMTALRKMAAETGPRSDSRDAGDGSETFRKTLVDLREALIKEDDDRIEDLEDELIDLFDEDENDCDDVVNITSAARRRAPEVLLLLRPNQVAAFFNYSNDGVPDPLETLLAAIEVVDELKEPEWKDLTEEIVEELRWQLGGLDPERSRFVGDKVEQFLKRIRSLNSKEIEKQRPELEKSARQFVAQVPPTMILHNYAEHTLAELLSNPRLSAALDARLEK